MAVGASHLRLLAVTAAACMVVMTVSCSSAETPQKSEFTQVTSSMFVDRSAVPNSAAMEFTAPSISSDTQGPTDPVDPPECAAIFGDRPTPKRDPLGGRR